MHFQEKGEKEIWLFRQQYGIKDILPNPIKIEIQKDMEKSEDQFFAKKRCKDALKICFATAKQGQNVLGPRVESRALNRNTTILSVFYFF